MIYTHWVEAKMSDNKKPKTALTIRLDSDLADQFKKIAHDNNRNQSILIRDFIAHYIKKNGQGDLFK